MVIPRILAGRKLLDKLPYWVALPFSIALGVLLGYAIAVPDLDLRDLALTILAVAVVLALGLSAPRAVSDSKQSRPRPAPGDLGLYD